jgi:hypothetical protein
MNRASPTLPRSEAQALAQGLGWFSLALGLTEILAPRPLARWLGMEGSEPLLQTYGFREIGSGVGILASNDPTPWVWSRVAGDGLDIATLTAGLGSGRSNKGNIGIALAAVLGVTVLDTLCAGSLTEQKGVQQRRRQRAVRDYSTRSGFQKPARAMRGAAHDFVIPDDMRAPKLMRPFAAA